MATRFFILAGEPSGDTLGSEMMRACSSVYGTCQWFGMGGPKMAAQGLNSEEDMEQLSIIGIAGIVGALPRLTSLSDRLLEQIIDMRPDAVFTIDSKMFSVRFALKLKQIMRGSGWKVPIIHIVAPTIWAWGSWRKNGFEDAFDGLICLFPFEPALFNQKKVKAVFSGHPAAWRYEFEARKKRNKNLICLLPGSRRREIASQLPLFLSACSRFKNTYNEDATFYLPSLPYLRAQIEAHCAEYSSLSVSINDKPDAVSHGLTSASSMLCVSGTVTLEAGLAGMPGVVSYPLSMFDRVFVKLFVSLSTPVLPDIILESNHYPVLLSEAVTPQNLLAALVTEYDRQDARQQEMSEVAQMLRSKLRTEAPDFVTSLKSCLTDIL
tara:strand:+ start:1295 stop:2434 length:1140 start_codon:yes stop_codon:yes gene_type:complete